MSDMDLTQTEADNLIAMEKTRINDTHYAFPAAGEKLIIPLVSMDKREEFLLDINRGRIDLSKVTMQNRARKTIILLRLDLAGPPHCNPDGAQVPCPHIHIYREGFGDKWAQIVPIAYFPNIPDLKSTFDDFMRYCNVTRRPYIEGGLFT